MILQKIYTCDEGHVWVDITKRHVITCCKKSIEMTGCENAVLQKKKVNTPSKTRLFRYLIYHLYAAPKTSAAFKRKKSVSKF